MSRHSIIFAFILCGVVSALAGDARLGDPKFMPTPANPIGWRGDGNGRYQGANPPVAWERKRDSSNYANKGIVWMTPMPANSVGMPIIVGDRIFVPSEVGDLMCIDKRNGKIVWLHSTSEFEGLPESDRKDNPAYKELATLAADLEKVNLEIVAALNAQLEKGGEKPLGEPAVIKKKKELEKKIESAQKAIDKADEEKFKAELEKKPETATPPADKKAADKAPKYKKKFDRNWAQAVFGFAGQTPTSDGKKVCMFYTTGVSVCYDLDGNRKWIALGSGMGSEHGNFASPLLAANQLCVWANEMRGYDADSGKLLWTNPAKAFNTYGSMFKIQVGNDIVAAFQWGFFTRLRDGKAIWDQGVFGDSVQTPIVEGDTIFAHVGYPKSNDKKAGIRAFKIPASTDGGKLTQKFISKMEWGENELAEGADKKRPFDRGFVSSALLVDGLIYQVTQGGGLLVNDASNGELVYKKILEMKNKTEYWNWSGQSASPALAGKYIYLMDNQGLTLILQPGREYKEVARNTIEESKDGKSQAQFNSTPVFEGTRMYYRSPGFLYCVGQ